MIERKIVIGLITSTDFCEAVKNIWNPKLLESSTAKLLATWIWEYFNKYNKAPGKDIELIFYTKLKEARISKSLAEEIENDILPELSKEYVSGTRDVEPLIKEAEKFLGEQHLKIFGTTIQTLASTGKSAEAEKLINEFKPLGVGAQDIEQYICSVDEIRKHKKERPTILIKPWLKEGQVTIIYGNFGTGKSLLAISIAYLLGLHDYDRSECEIGEWQVKTPTGCLYMDGEIGQVEMEERIRQFEWLGKQATPRRIRAMCIPEYQLETEDTFFLSDRKNQRSILKWLEDHPTYRLIVLDSVSTLFGLIDENDNSEWNNKINPFLRDLRALGVACILLHHSGKDVKRGLRGASSMGAMAHNVFRIANSDKGPDEGEARFELSKEKQRSAGYTFKNFILHYYQTKEGTETRWEIIEM